MSPSFNDPRRGPRPFMFFPLIAVAMAFVLGAVVMLLWNAILPDLLKVPRIRYWQAVGLLVLCRILFGNFGPKGGGRFGDERFRRGRLMREKWMQMSPEERSRFKNEWRERCRSHRMGRDSRTEEL